MLVCVLDIKSYTSLFLDFSRPFVEILIHTTQTWRRRERFRFWKTKQSSDRYNVASFSKFQFAEFENEEEAYTIYIATTPGQFTVRKPVDFRFSSQSSLRQYFSFHFFIGTARKHEFGKRQREGKTFDTKEQFIIRTWMVFGIENNLTLTQLTHSF